MLYIARWHLLVTKKLSWNQLFSCSIQCCLLKDPLLCQCSSLIKTNEDDYSVIDRVKMSLRLWKPLRLGLGLELIQVWSDIQRKGKAMYFPLLQECSLIFVTMSGTLVLILLLLVHPVCASWKPWVPLKAQRRYLLLYTESINAIMSECCDIWLLSEIKRKPVSTFLFS